MKRIYILSFVFAAGLFVQNAVAQNLDPTVEVSRAYEGKIMEATKPVRDVNVPDSVGTFRLDFDYAVFENPYKGAYEFNPYQVSMRPSAAIYDPHTFYLKAGAGYRLYPELDLIWSPSFKNGFNLDVYASHQSYVGDYRTLTLDGESGGQRAIVRDGKEKWNGYDLESKAGVAGRYDWKRGSFDFNANYYGLAGKTYLRSRSYDALDANISIASNTDLATSFVYGVDLKYRYAKDKVKQDLGASDLKEHHASLDAFVGPVLKNQYKILVYFGGELATYHSAITGGGGRLYLAPHYMLRKGRWFVDAGVKIDAVLPAYSTMDQLYLSEKQQYAYPDVMVGFDAIKDALNIYATVTGGAKMNTYASILEEDHYADYTHGSAMLNTDLERVRTMLGFRGRVTNRFSYDIRGGYAVSAATLLPSVHLFEDKMLPSLGYSACQKAFAAFDWRLDTDSFKFDGTVAYTHTWGYKSADFLFAPAALTGNVALEYNWKRRIFAGIDCDFATARKMVGFPEEAAAIASGVTVPGYADLGLSLEYAYNRKLSFWLRGGNLCCMTIQRTPLYAEGGISFTAGICLNL